MSNKSQNYFTTKKFLPTYAARTINSISGKKEETEGEKREGRELE